MKALTIQQPYASLICSGIKDVENRSWQTKVPPGRILIHAGGKKVPKDFDIACLSPMEESYINNLKQFGIIPEYNDMPLSSIIGYVDVIGFSTTSQSMWAIPGETHWLLENAYLFDKPICNVKGKLGLFDYPIDLNNLPPAHKMKVSFPTIKGKKMIVHVSKTGWMNLQNRPSEYRIDIGNTFITDCICSYEDPSEPKPITSIEFVHDGHSITYKVIGCERIAHRVGNSFKREVIYTLGKVLKSNGSEAFNVAIRLIYWKAVTPSCDIVQMDEETWDKFRFAENKEDRLEIVLKLLHKEGMLDVYDVREIAWIPLFGQNKLILAPNAFDMEPDDD